MKIDVEFKIIAIIITVVFICIAAIGISGICSFPTESSKYGKIVLELMEKDKWKINKDLIRNKVFISNDKFRVYPDGRVFTIFDCELSIITNQDKRFISKQYEKTLLEAEKSLFDEK